MDAALRSKAPKFNCQTICINALSSGADADADGLVNEVLRAIDLLLDRSAGRVSRVNLVAVSCFWHSLVGIDAEGIAITPVFGWADTRAAVVAEQLRRSLDERKFHQRTGCRFHPSYWPAKLKWLRAERGELYQAVASWVSFAEYLQYRLFAETEMSVSMASGTGLLNQQTCEWDDDLLQQLEIGAGKLPGSRSPGKPLRCCAMNTRSAGRRSAQRNGSRQSATEPQTISERGALQRSPHC